MTENKSSQILDIQELHTRLEQWRQSRPKRSPIPDELWAAAAFYWPAAMELTEQPRRCDSTEAS
jgi:hypothetical protein